MTAAGGDEARRDAGALDEAALRAVFDEPAPLTVGAEEELTLVDPETLAPVRAPATLLAHLPADGGLKRELSAAQLESVTPVCASGAEAAAALVEGRRRLIALAGGAVRLAAAGVHPLGGATAPIAEGERYADIVALYGWAAPRGATAAGLHVHVAVRGADRVVAVHDALRSYLPELAALAGNAPFHLGEDTGLASVRPKLAEHLPRQGVPPAIGSWARLAELVHFGAAGGAFRWTELWWECRLNPALGTLELRVPDAQTAVEDAGAVVGVARGLVAWLVARHDAGERLAVHRTTLIAENRWRALRDGLSGSLLDLDSGRPEPTAERLGRLLETVRPFAEQAGDGVLLRRAERLLEGNGAVRQRQVAAAGGLGALAAWLADETERLPGA